jgi:hypothetical protein
MATREMDIIKRSANGLTKAEKVQLIEFLTRSLRASESKSVHIRFGKYRDSGRTASTADDFKIAEWNDADFNMNGN